MRPSGEMTERVKSMLTRDKMGVKDGFLFALKGDVERLLLDYFELDGKPEVKVALGDDGKYDISVTAAAVRIKHFDSTADLYKKQILK